MLKRVRFLAVIILLLAAGTLQVWARPHYVTYTNARFAFSIEHPDFMDRGPEPANGDGQLFQYFRLRLQITASGSNLLDESTAKQLALMSVPSGVKATQESPHSKEKVDVTLRWVHKDIISRIRVRVVGDRSISVLVTYPRIQDKEAAPIAKKVINSLRPTRPTK